jgi:hypothetical protein
MIPMTNDEALGRLRAAFAEVPRPGAFTRGTCCCAECAEHAETLAAHTPETMTLEAFGMAAWDPVCMASDEAFRFLLPGMARLALETDEYVDQLLFHLTVPGRLDGLDRAQREAVAGVLWLLARTRGDELAGTFAIHRLDEALRRLEGREP